MSIAISCTPAYDATDTAGNRAIHFHAIAALTEVAADTESVAGAVVADMGSTVGAGFDTDTIVGRSSASGSKRSRN
jgi:hypothetical protein